MLKYFLHSFHFFLFSKNTYQNKVATYEFKNSFKYLRRYRRRKFLYIDRVILPEIPQQPMVQSRKV